MGIWDEFFEKAKNIFGSEEVKETKKCYYELLEIQRNAGDDDIKRAYRKLALKYHPDKVDPEKREECTAYFVLLQQAYEVLSDPQERAFYDKHRENIIAGSAPEEKKDTGVDLYPFFQTCFIGFGDDSDGFYSVYRQVFDQLASEEYPYIDEEEDRDFPSFGYSQSEFDDVVGPFYSYWSSFCTKRSFAWLDKYDLRQADDRFTLKAMDKENKKLREMGKNARNEEIRRLVAYAKKRDKRVAKYRAEVEERKVKELDRVEQERKKMIRDNWEKIKDMEHVEDNEEHLEDLEKIENDLDEKFGAFNVDEDDESNCYCIVCEKKFKTAKSFKNHENSKKHKQAVEELKKFMAEDDKMLFGSEQEEEVEEEKPKGRRLKKNKKKRAREAEIEEEENVQPETSTPEEEAPVDTVEGEQESPAEESEVKESKEEDEFLSKKKQKTKAKAKKTPANPPKGGVTVPVESECKVCGQTFDSRSKLFTHIKDSGHAALKVDMEHEKAEKTAKNRKNRR